MKRKLFLLRLCRIFLPQPKPTLQVLNALFSQSSDARAFIIKLLNLKSFDNLNHKVTRAFLHQGDSRCNVAGAASQLRDSDELRAALAQGGPRDELAMHLNHHQEVMRKRYLLLLREASSVLEDIELMRVCKYSSRTSRANKIN